MYKIIYQNNNENKVIEGKKIFNIQDSIAIQLFNGLISIFKKQDVIEVIKTNDDLIERL